MGLADIAAGVEITREQRDRGVATVDRTDATLADRLAPHAGPLPCGPETAATIVEEYAGGASVGTAARVAGTEPVTAAKTLHLLGESVCPLGPTGRGVVRDWLAGRLSRTEAIELAHTTEPEFALAVYVETHDPLPAARAVVEDTLVVSHTPDEDPLAETRSETTDLL